MSNLFKVWRDSRKDLLSVWSEQEYRSKVMMANILGRQVVIANSPDSVKYIMPTNHQNFERKSPQMRRALEHLTGDGLFIREGETCDRS